MIINGKNVAYLTILVGIENNIFVYLTKLASVVQPVFEASFVKD